jgi:ATP-dependent Lhr-like helicase
VSFTRLHSALQYHILNSLEWRTLRPLQEAAIGPILDGANVLLIAPTAGGKTEAAIFPVLSEILRRDLPAPSVLYVCPIRALLNNIEIRLGWYASLIGRTCALWHGDVSQADKSAVLRNPPDILLTTPESLEAMLVSTRVNKAALFSRIQFVVADELHAFGADDRGWHLLHILSRIKRISGIDAQRIGLSATVGEPDRLLQWFCAGSERPSLVVAPPMSGLVDAEVLIDYVGNVPNAAHVISHLHRGEKRLAFTDSRSQAEELASFLRGQGVETFISHSSLSRDERLRAEQAFQDARDCVIVATSTLELGIDVGDLDRVIQIDAPTKVASFLQRLGRTGRRIGTQRNCLFLATNPHALVRAAAIEKLWRDGWVEPVTPPPFPVHVMAQQTLCRVIERGAIPMPELGSFLHNYDGLLACLLDRGMLHQDGGVVSIGPEAQRLWGARNYMELLSVFDTPELYTVFAGPHELGVLHELSFRRESAIVLLGGRSWRITSVDHKHRIAHVEPAEDLPGRSTWLGSSQGLSFEVCQAMRQVLLKSDATLSRRAAEHLELLATQGTTDTEGTVLRPTRTGCEWWTYGGLKANAALVQRFSLPATFDSLTIRAHCSPIELNRALNDPAKSASPEIDPRFRPKFAECLPDHLLAQFARERLYDWSAASQVERSAVVEVRSHRDPA